MNSRVKISGNLFITSAIIIALVHTGVASKVHHISPGGSPTFRVLPETGSWGAVKKLNVFCYSGQEKELSKLLTTVKINLDIEDDDFNYFKGFTEAEVREAHESQKSFFSFNIFQFRTNAKRSLQLNPFNETCFGLETALEYTVSLQMISIDLSKLMMLLGGVSLFLFADKMSKKSLFFYCSGVAVGNVASALVLVYFISKLFPRKPLMYGVLATGWSLAAYFLQLLVDNVQSVLITYRKYALLYILTTSIVSFAFCYYRGPPKNYRSINLIKWALQASGLLLIYFSSEYREASLTIAAGCIVLYYFPFNIAGGVKRMWRKKFPPKRRLLSKEEYEEQGRQETEKALKELREYVTSPKCKNQWRLVQNLSNPGRFASFVQGDDHVTQNETFDYEDAMITMDNSDLSDDSSEMSEVSNNDTIDESIALDHNFRRLSKSKVKDQSTYEKRHRNTFNDRNGSAKISSSTPNTVIYKKSPRTRKIQNYAELSDDND